MSHSEASYTTGSVFGHLRALVFTSSIGIFAIFIVDLVDVYFIALLGEPELAASVGFAGVGLFFGAALTIGLSVALSTLVAQSMGEGDRALARRYVVHGLIYTLMWTIPVTLLMLWYAPELLAFIGATDATLTLAVEYFRIVGASLPVLGLAMGASSMLRSVGDAKMSMWSTIYGGLVNAVFDPIFIFLLGMELKGAAIASVLSRCTVAVVSMYGIFKKHDLLTKPHWNEFFDDVMSLNGIALPSLVTNLSGPVSAAYATAKMARFGVDAVAAASVVGRITPVAFAGLYGLSMAVGPVASQNVGAGNYHRVKESLIGSAKIVLIYVIPVVILLYFVQHWMIALFNLTGDAAELLSFYSTFVVISYLLFGLQLAANPIFVSLRHPGLSTASNVLRDLVLAIPMIFVFSEMYGARGVLAGQAIANAAAGLVAFGVALWLIRRVEDGDSLELSWCKKGLHHHRHVVVGVQHRGH